MLLANRLVAQDLSAKDIPALYRVHEDPSESKVQALVASLGRLGYKLDMTQVEAEDLQSHYPRGRRVNLKRSSLTRCCYVRSSRPATVPTTWVTSA